MQGIIHTVRENRGGDVLLKTEMKVQSPSDVGGEASVIRMERH